MKHHWASELNMLKSDKRYLTIASLKYVKRQAHKQDRSNAKWVLRRELEDME